MKYLASPAKIEESQKSMKEKVQEMVKLGGVNTWEALKTRKKATPCTSTS